MEMSYDEVVDAMELASFLCEHKKDVLTDAYGNERMGVCRHTELECEYKRLLVIEVKLAHGYNRSDVNGK